MFIPADDSGGGGGVNWMPADDSGSGGGINWSDLMAVERGSAMSAGPSMGEAAMVEMAPAHSAVLAPAFHDTGAVLMSAPAFDLSQFAAPQDDIYLR
jgi:hypothetical protein